MGETRVGPVSAITLGLAAGLLAAGLDGVPRTYLAAAVAGVAAAAAGLVLLRRPERLFSVLLALFAFATPVSLDANLLHRPHVGGAAGITISLSLLAACACLLHRLLLGPGDAAPGAWRLHTAPSLLWPAIALMVAGALSLVNAARPDLVLLELVRLASLLAVMVMVASLRGDGELRTLCRASACAVLVQGALASAQHLRGRPLGLRLLGEESLVPQDIGDVVSRATGTVGHPNILAYYFEMLLPVMLALLLVESRTRDRLLYLLAFAAGCAGVLSTLSRGAWLTLLLSLPAVFLAAMWGRLASRRVVLGLVATAVLCALPLYRALPLIEKRLTHDDYRSAYMRLPLNEAALSLVRQFPVLGVGLNNYAEVFYRYDQTGRSRILQGDKQVVHNLYLLVWAEVGTIGLLAFLAQFAAAIAVAIRALGRADRFRRGLLAGVAAGIAAHLVHGFFDAGYRVNMAVSVLVYSMLGLVSAASREQQ